MCNWSEAIWEMSYDEGKEDGRKEGGIAASIEIYRQYLVPDDEIIRNLMDRFALSEKEAQEYLANAETAVQYSSEK